MPYAEPTSPSLSPVKDRFGMPRRHSHGGGPNESPVAPSSLPAVPRRSTSLAASTPRKGTLVNSPRHQPSTAATSALEAMRTVQIIPRRSPPAGANSGSLGLKLNTPHMARDSQSSDSSIAPTTPEDKNVPLVPKPPISPRPALIHTQQKSQHQRFPSTGSSPSEPNSPQVFGRPSGMMIRKKSGEILKPSLKQRSMSTPNLGRSADEEEEDDTAATKARANASRSTRDLGEHAKSVRFNDMGLESVVLFLRKQKPAAVSKTADTNEIPTETDEDNDTDLSDYVHFRTRRSPSRTSGEEQTEIQIASSSSVPRVRVDFGPGTHGILKDEHVVLERFELSNSVPLTLRGTVIARNVAFQKWVAVRFTLDHWQTTSEVAGMHVSHMPSGTTGDEGWDRFSFAIKLEDYRGKLEHRSLHLCVRYSVEGNEWWDSNNGDNYQFTFKAEKVRKPRSYASAFHAANNTSGAPVLRQTRTQSLEAAKNPRNWTFPRSGAIPRTAPRSASPMLSPPPAGAYRPPGAPDVHTHLNLRKWCAPSPPQSPPKMLSPEGSISLAPTVLPLAPERERAALVPMTLVHGRPATSWPPVEKKDVFSSDQKDGETTPLARSPESMLTELPYESPASLSSESEEETKIPPRRSSVATDLHSLGATAAGLMTPPSSNLSSPETPTGILPPESPLTTSTTSDSSPVKSISSSRDETGLLTDGNESRGRTLNASSYQEFLDKFCFFKSPPSVPTTLDDTFSRMSFPPSPHAGYVSPPAYYTYSMGNATPPGSMTPTFDSNPHHGRSTTPTPNNPRAATPRPTTPTRSPPSNAYQAPQEHHPLTAA